MWAVIQAEAGIHAFSCEWPPAFAGVTWGRYSAARPASGGTLTSG